MKITNMANTTCWIYVGIVAGLFCSGAVVAEEALAEVREPAIEQCVLLKLKSQDQPQTFNQLQQACKAVLVTSTGKKSAYEARIVAEKD